MKRSIQIATLIILALPLGFPQAALSEVRIYLNNGRDIVADSCSDSNGKLVCEKMGGTFEIDKKDILDTKGITIDHTASPKDAEAPEDRKGQDAVKDGKEPVKSETETKGAKKQPEGVPIIGLKPEDEERLGQIDRKKLEMKNERQRLITEQEKLHEDIKVTGMVKTQAQLDAIKSRIKDLETRIIKFNEDAKKLNDEEKNIIEGNKNK